MTSWTSLYFEINYNYISFKVTCYFFNIYNIFFRLLLSSNLICIRFGDLSDIIKNSGLMFLSWQFCILYHLFCFSCLFPQLLSFTSCLPLLWGCLIWAWLLSSDFFSTGGVCQSSACRSQNMQWVFQWVWHITTMLTLCVFVCAGVHVLAFFLVSLNLMLAFMYV